MQKFIQRMLESQPDYQQHVIDYISLWHFGPAHVVVEDNNYDTDGIEAALDRIAMYMDQSPEEWDIPALTETSLTPAQIYDSLVVLFTTLESMLYIPEDQR